MSCLSVVFVYGFCKVRIRSVRYEDTCWGVSILWGRYYFVKICIPFCGRFLLNGVLLIGTLRWYYQNSYAQRAVDANMRQKNAVIFCKCRCSNTLRNFDICIWITLYKFCHIVFDLFRHGDTHTCQWRESSMIQMIAWFLSDTKLLHISALIYSVVTWTLCYEQTAVKLKKDTKTVIQ